MSAIPEIGHFALLLCLPLAIALAVLPQLGASVRGELLMRSGPLLANGLWLFMLLAFVCLGYAFLHDDFSLLLVARHSNTALPAYYKISAVWGNHEGSLLLWMLILASWTVAVAWLGKSLPPVI
ncbi:MAG: heme lyase NrfEFG subunit NrfE, partial [Gammaproteobacteria bacterium]|nr:heme lyase NrfEFG subunit NrfE [Gammaproteobacteria bacterium]